MHTYAFVSLRFFLSSLKKGYLKNKEKETYLSLRIFLLFSQKILKNCAKNKCDLNRIIFVRNGRVTLAWLWLWDQLERDICTYILHSCLWFQQIESPLHFNHYKSIFYKTKMNFVIA